MRAPMDYFGGSPTFHLEVTKVEGGYEARCPGQPQVPPVRAAFESDAIQGLKQVLQALTLKGELRGV